MRLLLDTHTFIWFVLDDPALSDAALQMIEDGEFNPTHQYRQNAGSVWCHTPVVK
jgi:PIN domain nuclease of toxin-antitoxin system